MTILTKERNWLIHSNHKRNKKLIKHLKKKKQKPSKEKEKGVSAPPMGVFVVPSEEDDSENFENSDDDDNGRGNFDSDEDVDLVLDPNTLQRLKQKFDEEKEAENTEEKKFFDDIEKEQKELGKAVILWQPDEENEDEDEADSDEFSQDEIKKNWLD